MWVIDVVIFDCCREWLVNIKFTSGPDGGVKEEGMVVASGGRGYPRTEGHVKTMQPSG